MLKVGVFCVQRPQCTITHHVFTCGHVFHICGLFEHLNVIVQQTLHLKTEGIFSPVVPNILPAITGHPSSQESPVTTHTGLGLFPVFLHFLSVGKGQPAAGPVLLPAPPQGGRGSLCITAFSEMKNWSQRPSAACWENGFGTQVRALWA